eukprot:m.99492 g.99492  ORF g.99492 m.99492 type:complete len:1551 (+) comp13144_c1_seq1:373-5025(+)
MSVLLNVVWGLALLVVTIIWLIYLLKASLNRTLKAACNASDTTYEQLAKQFCCQLLLQGNGRGDDDDTCLGSLQSHVSNPSSNDGVSGSGSDGAQHRGPGPDAASTAYIPRPVYRSRVVHEHLCDLVDHVVETYVSSWSNPVLGPSANLPMRVKHLVHTVLSRAQDRFNAVDMDSFMARDLVEILRHHQSLLPNGANLSSPTSPTSDRASSANTLADGHDTIKLHSQVTSLRDREVFMRDVAATLVYNLMPEQELESPAMQRLLIDLVWQCLVQPTIESWCDPYGLNSMIVSYFSEPRSPPESNQPGTRIPLAQGKGQATASHPDASTPKKLSAFAYANYQELFQFVTRCTSLPELQELRLQLISQIIQAQTFQEVKLLEKQRKRASATGNASLAQSGIDGTGGTLGGGGMNDASVLNLIRDSEKLEHFKRRDIPRFINQCRRCKAECERRILSLGGPDYTNTMQPTSGPTRGASTRTHSRGSRGSSSVSSLSSSRGEKMTASRSSLLNSRPTSSQTSRPPSPQLPRKGMHPHSHSTSTSSPSPAQKLEHRAQLSDTLVHSGSNHGVRAPLNSIVEDGLALSYFVQFLKSKQLAQNFSFWHITSQLRSALFEDGVVPGDLFSACMNTFYESFQSIHGLEAPHDVCSVLTSAKNIQDIDQEKDVLDAYRNEVAALLQARQSVWSAMEQHVAEFTVSPLYHDYILHAGRQHRVTLGASSTSFGGQGDIRRKGHANNLGELKHHQGDAQQSPGFWLRLFSPSWRNRRETPTVSAEDDTVTASTSESSEGGRSGYIRGQEDSLAMPHGQRTRCFDDFEDAHQHHNSQQNQTTYGSDPDPESADEEGHRRTCLQHGLSQGHHSTHSSISCTSSDVEYHDLSDDNDDNGSGGSGGDAGSSFDKETRDTTSQALGGSGMRLEHAASIDTDAIHEVGDDVSVVGLRGLPVATSPKNQDPLDQEVPTTDPMLGDCTVSEHDHDRASDDGGDVCLDGSLQLPRGLDTTSSTTATTIEVTTSNTAATPIQETSHISDSSRRKLTRLKRKLTVLELEGDAAAQDIAQEVRDMQDEQEDLEHFHHVTDRYWAGVGSWTMTIDSVYTDIGLGSRDAGTASNPLFSIVVGRDEQRALTRASGKDKEEIVATTAEAHTAAPTHDASAAMDMAGTKRNISIYAQQATVSSSFRTRNNTFHEDDERPKSRVMSEANEDDGTSGWVVLRSLDDVKVLHAAYKRTVTPPSPHLPKAFPARPWRSARMPQYCKALEEVVSQTLRVISTDEQFVASEALFVFLSQSPEFIRSHQALATSSQSGMRLLQIHPMNEPQMNPALDGHDMTPPSQEDDSCDQRASSLTTDAPTTPLSPPFAGALEAVDNPVESARLAEPLFRLLSDVFELQGVFSWFRRRMISFVNVTYGHNIDRQLSDAIQWLFSRTQGIWYISLLRRNIAAHSAQQDSDLAQQLPGVGEEQKLLIEDEVEQQALKCLLDNPVSLVFLVGMSNYRKGVTKLFTLLQLPTANAHLMFCVVEQLMCRMFPDLPARSLEQSLADVDANLLFQPLHGAS